MLLVWFPDSPSAPPTHADAFYFSNPNDGHCICVLVGIHIVIIHLTHFDHCKAEKRALQYITQCFRPARHRTIDIFSLLQSYIKLIAHPIKVSISQSAIFSANNHDRFCWNILLSQDIDFDCHIYVLNYIAQKSGLRHDFFLITTSSLKHQTIP